MTAFYKVLIFVHGSIALRQCLCWLYELVDNDNGYNNWKFL